MTPNRSVSLLIPLLLALLLGACNKKEAPAQTEAPSDPMLVKADGALLAQIKVAPVETAPVAETLRVAGRIGFNEQGLARIGANVTGRVISLTAQLGQVVRKGDVLARLHSSELTAAELAYLKARSQMELNRRNAERAQALFNSDVISAAELQRRESEYEIASAETRAARDNLRVLGVPAASVEQLGKSGTIDSVIPIVSSIDGVIVERALANGQVVQPADSAFVVADLKKVWAIAQVPEQQVGQVNVGQSVKIEIPALRNEKLVGKLIFVSRIVNPDTRTVLVRTELDNTDGRLRPDMLAAMLIESAPVERLIIPATAVVREDDEDHVFIEQGNGVFRLTRVKLGADHDGIRVVLDGLKAGVRIVTDGGFHLNNQRNNKEAE